MLMILEANYMLAARLALSVFALIYKVHCLLIKQCTVAQRKLKNEQPILWKTVLGSSGKNDTLNAKSLMSGIDPMSDCVTR